MKKINIIILIAIAMFFLASCKTLTVPELALDKEAYIASDVFVLYFPYTYKGNAYKISNPRLKKGFRPIADYVTWHNERMDNDLRDMRSAHFDGVFLCLTPMDMADKNKREMIAHFLEKCSQLQFKVVFCLFSDTPIALGLENVVNYIQDRQWDKSPSVYVIDGKIPLVFNESITLSVKGDNTMFTPLYLDIANSIFTQPLPCPFDIAKSTNSPETILADRTKATILVKSINDAVERHSRRILVLSWNYYANGSAIEKNTFDYDTQLKALQ